MEILTKLTPAETYLLYENSKCEFKNLLKYTLIDLLIKKVLISEDVKGSKAKNTLEKGKYVSIGPNFKSYTPRPHELPFLKPFQKSEELQLLFKHLVKISYENAGSKRSFIFDLLLKNEMVSEGIKNDLFKRLFLTISLTEKGIHFNSEITSALIKLESELRQLIKKKTKDAAELLHKVHGNVFLLKSFDFKRLKKINKEYEKLLDKSNSGNSWGSTGCHMYFDTYSDSFDSEFSSAGGDSGSSGDSGCSSDASGCSGCSGCGGCGGCS